MLSDEQKAIVKAIDNGESLVILARAGYGKSETLKHALANMNESEYVVCAPTAAAAINIGFGAVTCHSLFGLKPIMYAPDDWNRIKIPNRTYDVLGAIKTLVIDECGMVRRDVLEIMDYRLRIVKDKMDIPFGGVQVVMMGDFHQVEPVVGKNERESFYQLYDSAWVFSSDSFKWLDVYTLTKNFRQSDPRSDRILETIRNRDRYIERAVTVLNNESRPYDPAEPIVTLCSYNKDAEQINTDWFNKNENAPHYYYSNDYGSPSQLRTLPVGEVVALKKDSIVRICANHPDKLYYNGMVGTVKLMMERAVLVEVDGMDVWVNETEYQVYDYEVTSEGSLERQVIASRVQIPLKLCMATTIHSSQGLTLDKVNIHLGNYTFANNIVYVALSRVRELSNIAFVRKLKGSDVKVDESVIEYYNNLKVKEIENVND